MGAPAAAKEVEANYPLSPSQQGMLFESLVAPSSGLHVEQSAVSWRGPLNVEAFVRAWHRVIGRHEILRTGFAWEGIKEPLQYVLRRVEIPVERYSFQDLPPEERREKLDRHLTEDRRLGFDLGRAPLMRLAVFALEKDLHRIVWTRHHILMDGWSRAIVSRELMALYLAECGGEQPVLGSTSPYKNYITWLRRQSLVESESFWRAHLAGFTEPTPVATKILSADKSKGYGTAQANLSPETTAALRVLSRQSKATMNTLVQACWSVLLHHYSGAPEVLFGATVSGRPAELAQVDSMVGLFLNSVPVRVKLSPVKHQTVHEWLGALQEMNTAQLPHGYCSTGQIHQWSSVPDSLPLYESLLVFENYPVSGTDTPKEEPFEILEANSVGAQTKYALTILILPGAELRFQAVYDLSRFAPEDIRELLAHLVELLQRIPAAAGQSFGEYIRCHSRLPPVYRPPMRRVPAPFVSPRTDVELRLARIWQTALGVPAIGVDDSFFDLGGHSLVALRLMAEIQKSFDVSLSLATLLGYPTIAQLAKRVDGVAATQELSYPTLAPMRSTGAKMPLFFVPGAGGNVLYVHELVRAMSADQPFYGLQSVGLDGITAPHSTVEAIATHNVRAIQSVCSNGPYLLAGHSFGGKVVFEMAQQLLKTGRTVPRLLILDATAPTLRPTSRSAGWDHARWAFDLVEVFCEMAGERNLLTYADLKKVDPDRQLLDVKSELERLNLLPPQSSVDMVRGLFNVLKSNRSATYAPAAVLHARITLFRAMEDLSHVSDIDGEEAKLRMSPDFGWSQFSQMPLEVVSVPGNHVSMIAHPHVVELARLMQNSLDEANYGN